MARNEGNLPVRHGENQWLSPSTGAGMWQPGGIFNTSPWQMMRRMQEDMDRIFGQFLPMTAGFGASIGSPQGAMEGSGGQNWLPTVDVSEDSKEFCIEVDLPGVNKDNIEVETQNGQLRIRAEMKQESALPRAQGSSQESRQSGQPSQTGPQGQQGLPGERQYHRRERRYGYFERMFTLPDNVNEDSVSCEFRDGVLTCHLPKAEQPQQQGRRIPVNAGGQSQTPQIQSSETQRTPQPKQKAA